MRSLSDVLMVKCTLTVIVVRPSYTHLGVFPASSLARSSSQEVVGVKKWMMRREGMIPPLVWLLIVKRNELSTGGT